MSVELLAALVVALFVVNLTVAWLLVRGDGLDAFLEADAWEPSDRNGGRDPDVDDRRSAGRDVDSAAGHPERNDAMPDGDPPPLDADGDVVVCRHCGTENRAGYRYCRWCVRAGFPESTHAAPSSTTTSQRPF